MRVSFNPAALAELNEAVAFYDGRAKGLGEAFATEVRSALLCILAHPSDVGDTPIAWAAHFDAGVEELELTSPQFTDIVLQRIRRIPGLGKRLQDS